MDKVSKTSELQGWRTADDDELKVIQGILLKGANNEKGSSSVMKVGLFIFIGVCLVGVKNLVDYIFIAVGNGDIGSALILLVMILVLLLILFGLGMTLIKNLTRKTAETYYEAINTNKLRVMDVQIEEVISLRGIGRGTDGHRVKVKDMYDVYCEENIVFECCNGYQKTRGILIEVPMREDENGIISRKCVIPCKEKDPRLWHIGMKNYNELNK